MRRREFIAMLGLTAWPLTAGAQQAKPVVGFLGNQSAESYAAQTAGFRQGLKTPDTPRARTSRSSTAGQKMISIGSPSWRPIS